MMICSLLMFISMFNSAEEAISHYNRARVNNDKGLTISSQKRYVKFFEGFLTMELFLRDRSNPTRFPQSTHHFKNETYTNSGLPDGPSWYELYLNHYNRMEENLVLREVSKKTLKLASISIGPFPVRHSSIRITISQWDEKKQKVISTIDT